MAELSAAGDSCHLWLFEAEHAKMATGQCFLYMCTRDREAVGAVAPKLSCTEASLFYRILVVGWYSKIRSHCCIGNFTWSIIILLHLNHYERCCGGWTP